MICLRDVPRGLCSGEGVCIDVKRQYLVAMSLFRRPFSQRTTTVTVEEHNGAAELSDGSLEFVAEKGGNDSGVSYQEASGAPVESQSPLGYHANTLFLIFLNIGKMIGTGVFSTRKMHRSLSAVSIFG